jgi:hypothetical protein
MHSLFNIVALASSVSAVDKAGGYISLSGDALDRGADYLIGQVISDLTEKPIPGQNSTLFWFEDVHISSVTIDSHEIAVLPSQGVQLTLKNIANEVAHTRFCVHDLLDFVRCCGSLWATGADASLETMNTIVLNDDGLGHLKVATHSFNPGNVVVHHQMDTGVCEAVADVIHVVDGVVTDLIGDVLKVTLPSILQNVIGTAADVAIALSERSVPIGLGKEKVVLDNAFVSVDYDNGRITHFNKGEFKSWLHPSESKLSPTTFSGSHGREIVIGFSDYVLNTLFDVFYQEHMFEQLIKLPLLKTPLSDKVCPRCPVVVTLTFTEPVRASYLNDKAEHSLKNMNLTLGVQDTSSKVFPLVTLSVDADASAQFSLEQDASESHLKASLSLEDFKQDLLISYIGDVDLSDIDRDVKAVLTALLDIINAENPGLPIPAIDGVRLASPEIVVDADQLLLLADLTHASMDTLILV